MHIKGLPRGPPSPQIPRKAGPIVKRPIPNVKNVLAVASGKGGVGKSTMACMSLFSPFSKIGVWYRSSEHSLLMSVFVD